MTKKAIYVVLQEFLSLLHFLFQHKRFPFVLTDIYTYNLQKTISTISSLYLNPHPKDSTLQSY